MNTYLYYDVLFMLFVLLICLSFCVRSFTGRLSLPDYTWGALVCSSGLELVLYWSMACVVVFVLCEIVKYELEQILEIFLCCVGVIC